MMFKSYLRELIDLSYYPHIIGIKALSMYFAYIAIATI